MSADRPAASDGGPVVSRTRGPVGDHVPPSRSQQVFHQSETKDSGKLAEVARHLLAGPAAITLSERSFSIAGHTIEDRRTQLSAESVDGLMFLHGLAE